MSAAEYYGQFCEMFRGCSTAASIWMLLVSSLPNPDLRSELHRVHYESVRNGGGFNVGAGTGRPKSSAKQNRNKKNRTNLREENDDKQKIVRTGASEPDSEVSRVHETGRETVTNIGTRSPQNVTESSNSVTESTQCSRGGVSSTALDSSGNNPPVSKTGKKGRFRKKEVLYRL